MILQDVADTGPVTAGPNLLWVAPLAKDEFTPRPKPISLDEKDLLFFTARSYQALIHSDGGD